MGSNAEGTSPSYAYEPTSFLRLLFCDFSGVRRCRVIPLARRTQAYTDGINLTRVIMALNAYTDSISPGTGLDAIGDVYIVVDHYKDRGWSPCPQPVLKPCPWYPTHYLQTVTLLSNDEDELGISRRRGWDLCPRTILSRVLDQFTAIPDLSGVEVRAGHEIEFILLHKTDHSNGPASQPLRPVDRGAYAQSTSVNTVGPVLDEICASLDYLGVKVEQYHAEAAPGQFEIVLEHDRCDAMADKILIAREVIACVASKHQLIATFLPKPFLDSIGSGAHTHLGLQSSGGKRRKAHDKSIEDLRSQFLAGLLHHLPALYMFIAPSPTSYWRLQPDTWSGAYRCWGERHKEAPLRLCSDESAPHIEVKGMDNTSNPHIALAALVTAGMQGIIHRMKLCPPLTTTPGSNSPDEMERLPSSLSHAIAAFERDTVFKRVLQRDWSEEFVTAFLGVRKEEAKISATMSTEAQIAHLLQRY